MRLIDLVISCLKETIRNDDTSFNVQSFLDGSLENNPEYLTEINNVLLSVNKAISRLCTMEKIPYKHVVLVGMPETDTYNITERANDIKNIKSVFTIKNGQSKFVGWMNFGKDQIYLGYGIDTNIHVIYAPTIRAFDMTDVYLEDEYGARTAIEDDLFATYGITDEVCSYIAYFAKSELYEDRDADRCKRYLNYFEDFITSYRLEQTYPHQTEVRPAYKVR